MQAKVVDKKSGSHRVAENNQNIALDRPSVVVLKVAPEKVARYERHGNDLTLVLKDGQKIVIQGFFARAANPDSAGELPAGGENAATDDAPAQDDDRNDLVLEDDNGVAWWGQYPEQWSEFHFTEIEWSEGGFGYALLLLGVVAAGAAIAVAAGGGGKDRDGGETTPPPVATDDQGSGDEDGGAVTGNVLANDRDVLRITQFTINGTTHNAGDSVAIPGVGTFTLGSDGAYTFPAHGSVTVNPDGTYTYTPDEDYSGTDSFTYTVTDPESGESLTRTVTITVEPAGPVDPEPGLTAEDDSATTDENTPVSGTVAGNDSTSSGGTLTFAKETDPAHGSVTVNPDGTYLHAGRGLPRHRQLHVYRHRSDLGRKPYPHRHHHREPGA